MVLKKQVTTFARNSKRAIKNQRYLEKNKYLTSSFRIDMMFACSNGLKETVDDVHTPKEDTRKECEEGSGRNRSKKKLRVMMNSV
jgi:hypothetical protein